MFDDPRLQFDVAFALAATRTTLPTLPKRLEIDGELEQMLHDLIEPGSIEGSSCRFRAGVHLNEDYRIDIGDAKLFLAPEGWIRAGGSGVAIQVLDRDLKRSYALKVPRISVLAYEPPDYRMRLSNRRLETRLSVEVRAFNHERDISRQLSHQNIVRYFYGGTKFIPGVLSPAFRADFPFSVSEWIDGARPMHKYLIEQKPDLKTIMSLICDTLSALEEMRRQGVVHWDIKSDNVLIDVNKVAKLIDFGNAKLPNVPREHDLTATSTRGKYPQLRIFREKDAKFGESNRFSITLPHKSWNHPFIDLWMLIQEWNRALQLSREFVSGDSKLSEEDRTTLAALVSPATSSTRDAVECLRIIFDRVLFPFDSLYVAQFVGGKEKRFEAKELYYKSAADVMNEIGRISRPFGAAQDIPELLTSLDEIVRLPVTGNSIFTERVAALVDGALVRPTALHYQLAQVRQVFPGASHSRFEHLLGTLTTTSHFIRSLYLNELNSFWRVSAESNDIKAVLLASIFHDAGHLASGHFIEEMDDLMFGLKHEDYVIYVLKRCLKHLAGEQEITRPGNIPTFTVSENDVTGLIRILAEHWCDSGSTDDTSAQVQELLMRVISILNPERTSLIGSYYLRSDGTRQAIDNILRSIIDGPIDADKLDYLRRDAFHAGVSYANGIDLERFFESLRVCVDTVAKRRDDVVGEVPAIGISEKGVGPTETIITARYHMYTIVYWHRTVRSITAMLQRVISEVRLKLKDAEWSRFMSVLLTEFRNLDDRQAMEGLKVRLEVLDLLGTRLRDGRASTGADGTTISDLIDALLGDRAKYFRMAFELQYDGRIDLEEGQRTAEVVHDSICKQVHPDRDNDRERLAHTKTERQRLAEFRKQLETAFSAEIRSAVANSDFRLDTILIDVPEPGKDQIRGLRVDKRNKRSMTRQSRTPTNFREDYIDLATISPIVAAMENVFGRWARKVRIYMTPADIRTLGTVGLGLGDIGAIWEKILYRRAGFEPGGQLVFDTDP